jgi:hypothetical protein
MLASAFFLLLGHVLMLLTICNACELCISGSMQRACMRLSVSHEALFERLFSSVFICPLYYIPPLYIMYLLDGWLS